MRSRAVAGILLAASIAGAPERLLASVSQSPVALAGVARGAAGYLDPLPTCASGPHGAPKTASSSAPASAREPDAPGAVIAAIRAARRSRPREAARALERAIRDHPASPIRACALLELARIELLEWRGREALATLARAERDLAEFDDADLWQRLAHARAEALVLLGRDDEARPLLESLRRAPREELAWAAGIRLLERDPAADWDRLESWVDRGRGLDQDLDSWALRIAELAFAAERFDDALYWITRAEVYPHGDLATLRKADVLVGLGREDEASGLLQRFAERGDDRMVREIASLRLVEHDLVPPEERDGLLARAAASASPEVSAGALRLSVLDALAAESLDAALGALARLRQLEARTGLEDLNALTARVLDQATASDQDCVTVVLRLGGLREAWLRAAETPATMLRLGDCALDLGLGRLAGDVFRAVARRFPEELGADLAYRIARSALDAGERSTAAALMERGSTGVEDGSPEQRARWLWLETRLTLDDGREREAFAGLERLLGSPETPPAERVAAERALLGLSPGVVSPEELRETLRASLGIDLSAKVSDGAGRALARLRLADLLEAAGERDAAHEAYGLAIEGLPAGPLRDRARYARAWLSPEPDTRVERLRRLAESEDDPSWAALARSELRIEDLDRLLDGLRRSGL